MGSLLVTFGALVFSFGAYQLGFVKGYESQKEDEVEAIAFVDNVISLANRKGMK